MAGTLYVCATPLGNLEDLTLRALRVLGEVPVIAAENIEKTRALLTHFSIRGTVMSYREENRTAQADAIIELLNAGSSVALVSEAGTPAVSDPGGYLVERCRAHGLPVIPLPGPSAATAALSVSGFTGSRFFFAGFLPASGAKRRKAIEELAAQACPVVLYEGPHRLVRTLSDLLTALGNRRIFLGREMTKKFEEYRSETIEEALSHFASVAPRGELVVIVEGADPNKTGDSASDEELTERLRLLVSEGSSRKDAARRLASELGLPAKRLYALAITLHDGEDAE